MLETRPDLNLDYSAVVLGLLGDSEFEGRLMDEVGVGICRLD